MRAPAAMPGTLIVADNINGAAPAGAGIAFPKAKPVAASLGTTDADASTAAAPTSAGADSTSAGAGTGAASTSAGAVSTSTGAGTGVGSTPAGAGAASTSTGAVSNSAGTASPSAADAASAGVEASLSAAGTGASAPKLIVTVLDSNNRSFEIFDDPLPDDCHANLHEDLDGGAVHWGLGHKVRSAAECCRLCKEHKPDGAGARCNVWTWCGDPSGICWTMDVWTHTTGDCWLKHQPEWDNNVNRNTTNLKVNHRHKFSSDFRAHHKTSPEFVPWVSGLIPRPIAP
ncbi:hypothetical protein FOA52_006108 [Chlamydomonas sp. UWO 241]|nr:hypothetical protein FOA52_006108 [Chlamydomonas sp. UWO 241]